VEQAYFGSLPYHISLSYIFGSHHGYHTSERPCAAATASVCPSLLSSNSSTSSSMLNPVETVTTQPENPFASLVTEQRITTIPSFTLESGVTLKNVPVAYTVRGQLSEEADNALIICHALSGSADVADWWGPLLGGPGRAFDISRFFVVCLNSLGSPYGSASPVTGRDGDSNSERYGPEFPLTTIRDDVKYA
jgi:homoserine O-acetyltransferase/O-succinyltransferase